MLIVFTKVATIFSMILVGWVANRKEVLPDSSIPGITNLMLYVTTPCLIMRSIYSKELTASLVEVSVQTILSAIVFFAIMTVLSIFLVTFLRFKPREDWGVYISCIVAINTGFMGLPVSQALFGDSLFYLMVMFTIVLNAYMFSVIPSLLHFGSPYHAKPLEIIKSICTNVIIIGIAIGILLLILGIKPAEPIDSFMQMMGDATVPLSMLLVGMQLGSSRIRDLFMKKENIIISLIRMFLIPLLVFLITFKLPFLETDVKAIILFASAFPTAVAPVALATQANKNSQTLAEIVSLTTLISLATLPLLAAFILGYYY